MAILSNHCVITSQCLQLCKQNLHQVCIYLVAITEWVYTFLILKISPVLGSFSRAGNNITGGSNRVGGWGAVGGGQWVGSILGYKMKQGDDWNPEAKFGLSMALHGPQITPN